ncbi:MAG TPA: DUF1993 domain-containing protein [Polyangiaceae bacterium]|nr:DUF1993 domain-containing protein [Polyangiaceae bacterium]
MYFQAISRACHSLGLVEVWLDKAEKHAAEHGRDITALLQARLAPDMKPFVYQVQSACDYVKAGAAWLTGQKPPQHEDNEQTLQEVRARIRKTVAFVETVKESDFARAGECKVAMSWAPPGTVLCGQDYLLQMVLPNVYFHLSMAYAILRHGGVPVGKMDFLGRLNWLER